jgi:hypothetical protein
MPLAIPRSCGLRQGFSLALGFSRLRCRGRRTRNLIRGWYSPVSRWLESDFQFAYGYDRNLADQKGAAHADCQKAMRDYIRRAY